MLTPHEFYRQEAVVQRILEYCGVSIEDAAQFHLEADSSLQSSKSLERLARKATVEYLSGWLGGKKPTSRKPGQTGWFFDQGYDVFRSVWDKQNITFLLDLEYVSHRFPAEAYLNQERVFGLLEPVYQCLWDIFREKGMKPLTLVTGQGYHFVFDVNSYDRPYWQKEKQVTDIVRKLEHIGYLEDTLQGKYEHPVPGKKRDRVVEKELGRVFDASGKILEFVVHKALKRLPQYGVKIPITIGDLVTGNAMQETISLDLSTYTSPLHLRVMRTAFSTHQKHHNPKKMTGAEHIPVQIAIPRHTPCNGSILSLREVFKNRRHFEHSANYAKAITLNIPEEGAGVNQLCEEFVGSPLHLFHQDYDTTKTDNPERWPSTYDRFDLRSVPPCVAKMLTDPNPALLQPTQIQTLVRVLTGKQWWHPKHVAGLIRSKYERDFQWDYRFDKHDAAHHANTWVRFYAGLLATGLDERVDQNCISHQEKELCTQSGCGYNLGNYR